MQKFIGILLFAVALAALLVWAVALPQFMFWKFFVITFPLVIYFVLMAGSRDSLRFLSTSILILLPVLGIAVPPRSWDLTVFDVLASFSLILLLIRIFGGVWAPNNPIARYMWIPVLCIFPSVLLGIDLTISIRTFLHVIGFFVVLIILSHFINESPETRNRAHFLLCVSLIIVSFFVGLERITGINFSTLDRNINAINYEGSILVYRSAGLFQDAQKAAQFIAVWMAYLVVIFSRGAFPKGNIRTLALVSIFFCAIALVITVSRAAIVSGFGVSLLAYLLLGRAHFIKKVFIVIVPLSLLIAAAPIVSDTKFIHKLLPESVSARFSSTKESADVRLSVWKESWSIFEQNPLFGIGPGNYSEYLMLKTPSLRKFREEGGFVPNQPENGYLKILYETGLVGALGVIVFSFIVFLRAKKAISVGDNEESTRAWAVLAGFAIFLITFFTLFTVTDERNAMLVVLLLVFLPLDKHVKRVT
jgi:O-antigen ligase